MQRDRFFDTRNPQSCNPLGRGDRRGEDDPGLTHGVVNNRRKGSNLEI